MVRIDVLQPTARHTPVLHMSATHFTAEDLYMAADTTELRARKELIVQLDAAHRGVGTASCGPDVLPQYVVQAGEYRFSYRVSARRS